MNFTRNQDEICVIIKDQGNGFDWNKYLDFSPERATHSHGRGIAMSRMIAFDDITFVEPGNEVHCKIWLNSKASSHTEAA